MTTARILCVLLLTGVAGCQIVAKRPQAGLLVVGGLLGSTIGDDKSQLSPTAFGTLLGAYHQTDAGKLLVRADRPYAEDAVLNSLTTSPDGQTSRWSNPGNGHAGRFVPINNYRSDDDLLCRDYTQSITIEGQTLGAEGTACLAHDGAWRIVELPIVRRQNR